MTTVNERIDQHTIARFDTQSPRNRAWGRAAVVGVALIGDFVAAQEYGVRPLRAITSRYQKALCFGVTC